jgi:hypothetical protein
MVVIVFFKKTVFLSHLCIKTIILPRQARDKHRESTQKKRPFSFASIAYLLVRTGIASTTSSSSWCSTSMVEAQKITPKSERKRGLFVLMKRAFPTFVPSLSWLNDVICKYKMAQKDAFSAPAIPPMITAYVKRNETKRRSFYERSFRVSRACLGNRPDFSHEP